MGHITKGKLDIIDNIVLKGTLESLGMPNFGIRFANERINIFIIPEPANTPIIGKYNKYLTIGNTLS